MAVRLRLQRQGSPKKAFYRLVAIDKRARRDGRPIEFLGFYDPKSKENFMDYNKERVEYWLKNGAEASKTVSSLIKKNP